MSKKGTKGKTKHTSKKKANKGLFNSLLFKIVTVVVIIGCSAMLIVTEKDCNDKETEIIKIQAKIDSYNMENEDLRRTLESDDLSAYMERVALEECGYAYPDERRFYDTSRH